MVRTSEQSNAPTNTAAIVGGFVLIPVAQLLAAWFACQGIELGIGHFRAYLACHEILKRRSFAAKHVQPSFGFIELAGLLGVTIERARLLIQQLGDAGFLACTGSSITFPDQPPIPDDLFAPFANTIGGGKGMLTVPRRLLRFLVKGASAATIAVALGALFRCASCRQGQPNSWGRFKASWIANAFRVGLRQVKHARKQLVNLGWLIVEGDDRQNAMNRNGRAYRINLDWSMTTARSAPPPPAPAAPSAPPLNDRNPPREEFKDQNPASGGSAGVQLSEGEGGTEIPNPPVASRSMSLSSPPVPAVLASPAPVAPPSPALAQSPTPAPTPTSPATGSPAVSPSARPAATPGPSPAAPGRVPAPVALPAPRLEDVRVEDLKDTGRLMDLLGQAVARGLVSGSEADRLRFVGAAEHALGIGKENPAGLFMYLVRGKLWRYLTQDDEDRANLRIKAFLRGPELPRVASSSIRPAARPMLSEDARMVIRVRSALAAKGYRGDPFPQVRRLDPSWTRERWDAALAELEGA
jgi:hypothetical protein